MSLIDAACERISSNPQFELDYRAIVQQSISSDVVALSANASLDDEALRRLMQSAALFAQSSKPDWRQLAYRISVGSLLHREKLGGIAEAARLTLARLGNYPAIKFAFGDAPEPRTITPSVFFEIVGRQSRNTVVVGDRRTVLTEMQKTVWDTVSSGASLALSAPTSAGKSFVFLTYIEQTKRQKPASNIVYLVPSRALISQVASDLRASGAEQSYGIATIPVPPTTTSKGTPIYVLTPERLQVLFYAAPELKFDIAIIDEAHLIGEGSRGIVLHSVLQDLQRRNTKTQFLFSSPQVRDPSVFGAVVGNSNVEVVKTTDSPVAQNIIFVNGDALNNKKLSIALWQDADEFGFDELETAIPLYNSLDRMIYASWALGAGSQSLIYAAGPAQCEDIAYKIKDLGSDTDAGALKATHINATTQKARLDLSLFAKEAVHQTYVLADTVLGGVGFHYGRIPALLRSAVETAFASGHLDYIVCTSTLLQGVNLPARNVFMQNPHKGIDNPIDPVDFWNLAGRAGRLGKDFQGNVFLIDYPTWDSAPLAGQKDEPVTPSLEATLVETVADLVEFVSNDSEPSGLKPTLEAAFSKLLRDLRHGQLDETLDRLPTLSPDNRARITSALEKANAQIKVDVTTLDASPQISGFRQQDLYHYMVKKIKEEGPDYLIPVHPSASFKEALDKLRPIFARVHRYLELKPGNHHLYWAPLALRWMRGEPLPLIIDEAIKYHKRQGRSRSNSTVIREILTAVESDLRFRYVNLLGCYLAVLKQALVDAKHVERVSKIPALTLYLELGAASQTMIHLMSIGLSRHTANVLAGLTANKEMDAAAARAFLQRLPVQSTNLSPYLIAEIGRVLQTS